MNRRPLGRALLALVSLASLAGCSAPPAEPSTACLDAMAAASVAGDAEIGELLAWSGTACGTAEAWLAALEQYPNALGYESAAAIDDAQALTTLCNFGAARTPVCEDAAASGSN